MSDTNVDVRVFYNEDDENYNKRDQLTQEGLRMVTQLITSRGLKQLAEYQRILGLLEYEVEIFRDGEKMPNVARDYQSYMSKRAEQAKAADPSIPGLERVLSTQAERVEQLIETLDGGVLDQLRDIANAIATMELRASGKFV